MKTDTGHSALGYREVICIDIIIMYMLYYYSSFQFGLLS